MIAPFAEGDLLSPGKAKRLPGGAGALLCQIRIIRVLSPIPTQYAPLPRSTTATVRQRMRRSSQRE